MHDPVQRMRAFIQQQKQRAFADHARAAWCRQVSALLADVEAVVGVFREGLGSGEPSVAVLCDPRRPEHPLVIAFDRRGPRGEPFAETGSASVQEVGASCVFRCDVDGMVHGYRYPFHGVREDARAERFIDLGQPAAVDGERLGHAVADFLEWAAVGRGRGHRNLSFWSDEPALERVNRAAPLRVIAA
jgi:hypothetical protein